MKIKVKIAHSFFDKVFGLINTKNPRSMLFYTRFGIHTFFMRHEIDVLVLDSSDLVKDMKKKLKPFRFFFYSPKYITVLELPAGFIDTMKIKFDDKIELTQ